MFFRRFYGLQTLPLHVADEPWYSLPIPPRWHRCEIASVIMSLDHQGRRGPVEHCRCGAVRFYLDTRWRERNTRRKSLAAAVRAQFS